MELANNKCYRNGINGLVVHKTDRVLVHDNEIFYNGAVKKTAPESRQSFAGLVINAGFDVHLYNNTVAVHFDDDTGFVLHNGSVNLDESGDNYLCGGRLDADLVDVVEVVSDTNLCKAEYSSYLDRYLAYHD